MRFTSFGSRRTTPGLLELRLQWRLRSVIGLRLSPLNGKHFGHNSNKAINALLESDSMRSLIHIISDSNELEFKCNPVLKVHKSVKIYALKLLF